MKYKILLSLLLSVSTPFFATQAAETGENNSAQIPVHKSQYIENSWNLPILQTRLTSEEFDNLYSEAMLGLETAYIEFIVRLSKKMPIEQKYHNIWKIMDLNNPALLGAEEFSVLMKLSKSGVEFNPEFKKRVFESLKAKDFLNCPKYQLQLGNYYSEGFGTEVNLELAFSEYQKSAQGGNLLAYNNLAVCYIEGEGTQKNIAKGIEYHQVAAAGGIAHSIKNLGAVYENGLGGQIDHKKALDFYLKALEIGGTRVGEDLKELLLLGMQARQQSSITQDHKRTLEFYLKALEIGGSQVGEDLKELLLLGMQARQPQAAMPNLFMFPNPGIQYPQFTVQNQTVNNNIMNFPGTGFPPPPVYLTVINQGNLTTTPTPHTGSNFCS